MLKQFIWAIPVASTIVLAHPAQATDAFCVITDGSGAIEFQDSCTFEQYGGNGSFFIRALDGLIAGRVSITVSIVEPDIAEVRGLTTRGVNSRWGQANRSSSDLACWIGSDFAICAY